MAYAELAGLPAVTGLWAVIGAMTVYALLGSSRQLSVGPESTTALMTATALAPLANGDPAALRRARRRSRPHRRRDRARRLHRPARLPGRPAVEAGPGRLPRRRGGDHDRRPARASSPASTIDEDNPLKAIWHFLTHLGEIHNATLVMSICVLIFLFVGSWLLSACADAARCDCCWQRSSSRSSTSGPRGSRSWAPSHRACRHRASRASTGLTSNRCSCRRSA